MKPRALLLVLVLAGNSGAPAQVVPQAADRDTIYRYDLLTDKPVPVPREELKVGCIYNHFSPRLNRRAWSYLQSDGTFWHALGEGTTQEARRMDVRATEAERQQRLRENPDLAQEYSMTGGKVFVRLTKDGRWVIVGVRLLATIYDAETGQLWDRYGDKYIPVGHSSGKRWAVRDGRYYPAG
ncbi:MAG: hypothetical protein HUU20_29375 [Pirellulales bacterium]|nr:hypothetical protein [Pirellulales bacterium]